jgi:hypothetical protein
MSADKIPLNRQKIKRRKNELPLDGLKKPLHLLKGVD